MTNVLIIGFGEAGQALAKGWGCENHALSCFDIKIESVTHKTDLLAAGEALRVNVKASMAEALETQPDLIFSTVTAASAKDVAVATAAHPSAHSALFFDGNSCAPSSKQASAQVLEAAGYRYCDLAIMAPIHPRMHKTPMLLAGPYAEAGLEALNSLDMEARPVGDKVGQASSIKMLRSIAVKGLEALTTELSLAAIEAGVEDAVFQSLEASYPGFDWRKRAAYNLERMTTHGIRRAEEMREVVKTIEDLGHQATTTKGTVERQQELGQLGLTLSEDSPLNELVGQVASAIKSKP